MDIEIFYLWLKYFFVINIFLMSPIKSTLNKEGIIHLPHTCWMTAYTAAQPHDLHTENLESQTTIYIYSPTYVQRI